MTSLIFVIKNYISLLLGILSFSMVILLISEMTKEGKFTGKGSRIELAILFTVVLGVSVPFSFFVPWFSVASLLSLASLTSILLYPKIKYKKLVSKYRDSEEGLIKP
jgi:hypothetical protein